MPSQQGPDSENLPLVVNLPSIATTMATLFHNQSKSMIQVVAMVTVIGCIVITLQVSFMEQDTAECRFRKVYRYMA